VAARPDKASGPLAGIRVVNLATMLGAGHATALLADFGADVITVELPGRGDSLRQMGPFRDGDSLRWAVVARGKRSLTLDLHQPDGQAIALDLARTADVVVENFRPGTLERWNLGWDVLTAENPGLVLARVSGFGQDGPYAHRAGFGTLAEAMSGFAALNGEPDGPPLLPPLALADGVTALATAFAILAALRARETTGRGQVVDVSLLEPLMTLLGPGVSAYAALGELQPRTGNRSGHNAPRNVYRTADDRWVAVSSSATSIAERVMRLVGRGELVDEPWFATGAGRVAHVDEIDGAVASWIGARTRDEVLDAFDAAGAAAGPVYDAQDVLADPHFEARGTIATVEDPDVGPLRLPGVVARLGATPGEIRWAGRGHGADTADVLAGLGVDADELERLRERGVV
jgi:crotonobetainyl-CoA:carnitine CoA-transferase CaiB-like acyl-CoA transferase